MREYLKRLERLEGVSLKEGGVFLLLKWIGEPKSASRGADILARNESESAEAFERRAIEHFRPAGGIAFVSVC